MIKEIKYNGYTATPSDYECPDGDLATAINFVPEDNGMLKPVMDGEEIGNLPSGEEEDSDHIIYSYKYRLLFVHKNTSYKHLILVKEKYYAGETDFYCQLFWINCENEGYLSDIIADALSGGFSPISIPHSYTCEDGKSISVSAIGNTLIVTGAKDGLMHYVLWKDSAYKYLGTHLPEIYLSFSLKGEVDYKAPSNNFSFDNSTLHLQDPERIRESYYLQIISYAARKISDAVMGFVAEKVKDIKDGGYFIHPFFVRYALRLYDGSLSMHSAPILMNPCTTCNPFVYASSATEEWVKVVAMFVKTELECKLLNGISDMADLSNWEDIITSVDIFVSNQMIPYNQDGDIEQLEVTTSAGSASSSTSGRTGRISGLANNRSTLVRDSVFIGSFDGTNYAQFRYTHIYGWYPRSRDSSGYEPDSSDGGDIVGGSWPKFAFSLPELEDGQMKKELESASEFYFLASIPISELSEYTTRKKVEFPVTRIDAFGRGTNGTGASALTSILGAEHMTDDYHSHDKISPRSILDYNSRLNLAGINRTLFKGFPLSSMLALCNTRYNYAIVSGSGGGSRPQSNTHAEFQYVNSYDRYLIVVYLKENGVDKEVVCNLDRYAISLQNYLSDMNSNEEYQPDSWGNYLFYPNANAHKMRIIHLGMGDPLGIYHASGEYYDIELSKHDFLNGAYAFLDYNTVRLKTGTLSTLPYVFDVVISELGKIYTSDANNPFVFSTTNINTIGTGDILNIATAAKALSQGQFGQFPLYLFTTEGVWALEVSSTGSFIAKQPITRDVCINPESITQLDNAVIFVTDRGIMLLSGSNSICISDEINNIASLDVGIEALPGLENIQDDTITTITGFVPFNEFLGKAMMLYDYTHQHIIAYNPEKDYAYIYSLKSKQWGMMRSNIEYSFKSYPECIVISKNDTIINLSKYKEPVSGVPQTAGGTNAPQESNPNYYNIESIGNFDTIGQTESESGASEDIRKNALLITRPLKLDAPDILKTIDTIIQRGKFEKGHVKTILYGSRDLFNWHLVYSSTDHYLRGFRGTPYKFFRIVLLCKLSKDESIFGCTVQYTPRLLDQPR